MDYFRHLFLQTAPFLMLTLLTGLIAGWTWGFAVGFFSMALVLTARMFQLKRWIDQTIYRMQHDQHPVEMAQTTAMPEEEAGYLAADQASSIQQHISHYLAPPELYGLIGDLADGIYFLGKQHYLTEQRLREVLGRIQASTKALRDAIVLLDENNALIWWNVSANEMLGFRFPQDKGQVIYNLIRDPRFKQYYEACEYDSPLTLTSPVSDYITLQFEITLYGMSNRLMLVRDVTHVHALECMRKEFVANVSHELRTPLTVIKGYVETLSDNLIEEHPRLERPLQQMSSQVNRMENLVRDLLLLSYLETDSHQAKVQAINLNDMLSTICSDAKAISQGDHEIALSCEEQIYLRGYENELRSALSNLVINAVKYTPNQGFVSVKVSTSAEGLVIAVQDTGIGIEPQHIARLTERFYRVDSSRSNETGGTGLGLAIVKHVLIRHNGYLHIESTPDVGSIFSCNFALGQFYISEQTQTSVSSNL